MPAEAAIDASFLLPGRKLGERVTRAAFLETAGALVVVELAMDLHPGELAQRDRLRTRGVVDRALDTVGRCLDVGEGHEARIVNRCSVAGENFSFVNP